MGWLYHKDEWAKTHPVFDGLPCGGMMDYAFYREIIPDAVFTGQDPPAQAIAGANNASFDYSSGLMLAEYRLGAGRFFLNTLLIREKLLNNPVAERLLRNLVRHAAANSANREQNCRPTSRSNSKHGDIEKVIAGAIAESGDSRPDLLRNARFSPRGRSSTVPLTTLKLALRARGCLGGQNELPFPLAAPRHATNDLF